MMYPFRLGAPLVLNCGPNTHTIEIDVRGLIPKGARGFYFINPNLFTCLLEGTPLIPANTPFRQASYETSHHVFTGHSRIFGTLGPRALSVRSIDGPAASYLDGAKAGNGKLLLQYMT